MFEEKKAAEKASQRNPLLMMILAVATIRITTGMIYDDVVYVKMLSDEKEIYRLSDD